MHGLAAPMLQSCHVLLVQAQSHSGVLHSPVCRAGHPGPCAPGRNRSRTPTSSHADTFAGSGSRCIRTVLCRELLQTPTPRGPIPRLPPPPACGQPPALAQLCFGPCDCCCSGVSRREGPGCGAVPAAFPSWDERLTLTTCHPWQLGILAPPSLAEASHADKLGALPAQEFSAWSCSVWWEMPLNLGRFRDRDKSVPDPGPLKAPGCSSNGVSSASGVSKCLEISEVENCLPLPHSEGTNTFNC